MCAAAVMAMLVALAPFVAAAVPRPVAVVRPVDGEVVTAFEPPLSRFGAGHRGVDLAAPARAPVRSVLAGRVTFAGEVANRGWVTVDHGGGLVTTYGVLGNWYVAPGEQVDAGDLLGKLDGDATHLDWGARIDGVYIDPLPILGQWEAHLIDPAQLDAGDSPPRAEAVASAPSAHGTGLVWPARGRVSSRFGLRSHPITRRHRAHQGVDIAAPRGTPVVAASSGVVRYAGARGGYGLLVIIDHGDEMTTRYAHADKLAVAAGERVQRGQVIASVGSTGQSTGPHLHFEVHLANRPRDPLAFF